MGDQQERCIEAMLRAEVKRQRDPLQPRLMNPIGRLMNEAANTIAALRTAPEGFVMVQASALDGIRTAAEACWAQSQDKSFAEWVRDRANGEARGLNAALTMLAARPQGVKDVP